MKIKAPAQLPQMRSGHVGWQIDFSKKCTIADIFRGISMESGKRKISGREKDKESVALLDKLRGQLHSSNASIRRRAAYNLSWMQEDGLDILKSVLFGNFAVTSKNAASYGLRKMQGRMKKMAFEVFMEGLKQPDRSVVDICRNALGLLGHEMPAKSPPKKEAAKRTSIREIRGKRSPRRSVRTR
ncbi:MAG: hypothetical protein JW715_05765 [Sedimentisphaerales bacterium]|nr:hypothetical protein [Sedimentisphaerales bacterium]